MWQAPNSKTRGSTAQATKKRQRERYRRPLHLKRVDGEIKTVGRDAVNSAPMEARVVLNDLSPKGVGLFSPTKIGLAQEVIVILNEPRLMEIHGKVVWCERFDHGSHILSSQSFTWRLGIEFHFKDPTEAKAMESYCEELFKTYLYAQKPES